MANNTRTIIAKIKKELRQRYELTVNGVSFQVQQLLDHTEWQKKTDELKKYDWTFLPGEVVFAEDSNGNFFTLSQDGSVFFLDHETDERTQLCKSLIHFEELLQEPEDIELPPHSVISVWVDPNFKPEFD